MVTDKQYKEALALVKKYEKEQELLFRKNILAPIKNELNSFFETNLVSGRKIKRYELEANKFEHSDVIVINIKPVDPDFDEDYEDDWADAYIAEMGEKYNVDLGWVYWVYPK